MFDLSKLKSCGEDVYISDLAVIRRPELVEIGSHVAVDEFCVFVTKMLIGDYIHIAPMVSVIGGKNGLLIMEHFTTIAAGSRIICGSDLHKGDGLVGPTIPDAYKDKIKIAPVKLSMFSNVGTNVVIMPGVTLGRGSVVGANSFVSHDTEPWTIYIGNPAKPVMARRCDTMEYYAKQLGYSI